MHQAVVENDKSKRKVLSSPEEICLWIKRIIPTLAVQNIANQPAGGWVVRVTYSRPEDISRANSLEQLFYDLTGTYLTLVSAAPPLPRLSERKKDEQSSKKPDPRQPTSTPVQIDESSIKLHLNNVWIEPFIRLASKRGQQQKPADAQDLLEQKEKVSLEKLVRRELTTNEQAFIAPLRNKYFVGRLCTALTTVLVLERRNEINTYKPSFPPEIKEELETVLTASDTATALQTMSEIIMTKLNAKEICAISLAKATEEINRWVKQLKKKLDRRIKPTAKTRKSSITASEPKIRKAHCAELLKALPPEILNAIAITKEFVVPKTSPIRPAKIQDGIATPNLAFLTIPNGDSALAAIHVACKEVQDWEPFFNIMLNVIGLSDPTHGGKETDIFPLESDFIKRAAIQFALDRYCNVVRAGDLQTYPPLEGQFAALLGATVRVTDEFITLESSVLAQNKGVPRKGPLIELLGWSYLPYCLALASSLVPQKPKS